MVLRFFWIRHSGVSPLAHASGVPAGFGVTDGAGVEPAFVVVFALAAVTPEEFELLPDVFELPFEFVAEVLFAPGLFALPFDDLFAFEFVGGFVSEPPAFEDPAEFAFVDGLLGGVGLAFAYSWAAATNDWRIV